MAIVALIASCGEKKEEKKDGFEMNRTKSEKTAKTEEEGVPVDMNNDGVGPFKDVTFPSEINEEMAAAGEANYNACMACRSRDKINRPSFKRCLWKKKSGLGDEHD